MITIRKPEGTPPPEGYHQGVEVSGAVRTLYVAGQVGLLPDGTVAEGFEAQARAAYANMRAVLDAADMDFSNIVKTTTFLLNPDDRPVLGAIRAEFMAGKKSASTLVYISGLANPELLIEVEAVAVKAVTP